MGGIISFRLALRMGYRRKVIEEAISKAYLKYTKVWGKPEKEVLNHIKGMVGEPPSKIYV
jgi:hypothetical protein